MRAGNRAIWQRVETGKDEATYYTYDDADELTQHMKADVSTYFTYDNDGNQTSKKVGDSLCYYNYSPDNMLTTFTEGETDAEYVYDASPGIRRRVKAVLDGAVTYYAFDGLNVLADYDGDVSAQRTFVVPFLDDSLVLRTGGNDYHYTLDALGSVANLLDGNEAVQNDYLYEAFGSPHGTPAENVTNRLRYTGREWDPTPSLYQYRARWYAPALARFATRDPLRCRGPFNSYAYALNFPTLMVDPLGQQASCCAELERQLEELRRQRDLLQEQILGAIRLARNEYESMVSQGRATADNALFVILAGFAGGVAVVGLASVIIAHVGGFLGPLIVAAPITAAEASAGIVAGGAIATGVYFRWSGLRDIDDAYSWFSNRLDMIWRAFQAQWRDINDRIHELERALEECRRRQQSQ